jgi:hypothetical protein
VQTCFCDEIREDQVASLFGFVLWLRMGSPSSELSLAIHSSKRLKDRLRAVSFEKFLVELIKGSECNCAFSPNERRCADPENQKGGVHADCSPCQALRMSPSNPHPPSRFQGTNHLNFG